jgi:RNA polymerase nonessential primary-like sigma factor
MQQLEAKNTLAEQLGREPSQQEWSHAVEMSQEELQTIFFNVISYIN